MIPTEKSLGQIAAEAAGYKDWSALPASIRAEWQRGAEADVQAVFRQTDSLKREAQLSIQRKKP